ncbi:MAG: SDR family oxidoreductase, partial [Acetobacteraceae bacterium]
MYLENFDLEGRNALATGGGQGTGLACARALAEAGAHVVLADLGEAAAKGGQGVLEAGLAAEAIRLDVTDSTAVNEAAGPLKARRGSVDALFARYEHRPIGEKKRLVGEAVPYGRMGRPADLAGAAVFL